jgi:hypothetical protein
MRGKYKQKRLRKKYSEQFQYWNSNPDKFLEEFYGLKLFLWQKLLLKCKKGKV